MDLNLENVNYLMERLQPKCGDIIERCKWKGSLMRCDSLFQAINSSEGYCCSFNNYAFPKSNYDAKMVSSIPKQPRRVTACGYQTGLTLLLKPFSDEYFGTEIASNGFRVSKFVWISWIHHTDDIFPFVLNLDDDSQLVWLRRFKFGSQTHTVTDRGVFIDEPW